MRGTPTLNDCRDTDPFLRNFIVKTDTQEPNNKTVKLFIITNNFQAQFHCQHISSNIKYNWNTTLEYVITVCHSSVPQKLNANQLGNVLVFTHQCSRQIKLICLGLCGCWYHWPNSNLGYVLLCRKEQEQFKSPLGNFHCLHSCSLSWHWLLILALLLTSVWLEGYRNLTTSVIYLICKMQLIYLLWQRTEFVIIPGNSNYLNY